jgi:hypothetical protein
MSAADALPVYQHRERHAIGVAAPAETALAAARETRLDELPVVRMLFRLRGLRKAPSGPLWDAMAAEGFRLHGEDTLVGIGKPWRLRGSMREFDDFAAFDQPGYAKMALDLAYADGRLVTETRVLLTSAEARRAFLPYWLVIRPFSGLTRRSWLRAAKRRAEAEGRTRLESVDGVRPQQKQSG